MRGKKGHHLPGRWAECGSFDSGWPRWSGTSWARPAPTAVRRWTWRCKTSCTLSCKCRSGPARCCSSWTCPWPGQWRCATHAAWWPCTRCRTARRWVWRVWPGTRCTALGRVTDGTRLCTAPRWTRPSAARMCYLCARIHHVLRIRGGHEIRGSEFPAHPDIRTIRIWMQFLSGLAELSGSSGFVGWIFCDL